jgi:uncharacterized delta-60 repeat protein
MVRVRGLTVALCAVALAVSSMPALAEDANLDPTFSDDGKVEVSDTPSVLLSLARDSGDVYFAGERGTDRKVPFVGRLDDTGALDSTFSGDGVRSLPALGGQFWITGLTIDALGRTVMVAQSNAHTVVARFTTAGDLDPSFSGDGVREFRGGASPIYLFPRVSIDSQERLVVAAMVERPDSDNSNVVVRRLLTDGALDPRWSADGVKVVNRDKVDWLEGLAIDGRDRVLLGSDVGGTNPALVYRFRANGRPDPSFSDDGLATFRFQPHQNAFSLGIDVNAAGAITVAGASCCNSAGTTFGAVRLQPNGDLDTSYGDRGVLGLSCLDCLPTWGDVDGGRVAIVTNPYVHEGLTRLVTISSSGTYVHHQSVDIYPANGDELVIPVEIDGARTLLGGASRRRAFVARIA